MSKFVNAVIAQETTTQGKGKRVNGSTEPELILLPTINQFTINAAAAALMNLKPIGFTTREDGSQKPVYDKVTISLNKTAENLNEAFAIHKVPANRLGATLASVADETGLVDLKFNLANIYAIMLSGKLNTEVESIENLRKQGLVKANTSTKKVYYSLLKADGVFSLDKTGQLLVATEGDADTFELFELVDRSELPNHLRIRNALR